MPYARFYQVYASQLLGQTKPSGNKEPFSHVFTQRFRVYDCWVRTEFGFLGLDKEFNTNSHPGEVGP